MQGGYAVVRGARQKLKGVQTYCVVSGKKPAVRRRV